VSLRKAMVSIFLPISCVIIERRFSSPLADIYVAVTSAR